MLRLATIVYASWSRRVASSHRPGRGRGRAPKHLAAALVLPVDGLVFATWDRPLHAAAGAAGLELLPAGLA